ncbi:hypothetical protein [Roseateles chitosanitabidus]|uniref:hypothetical protein n=1 Tax=Roseateles chitosanitabidus TaxID=65048 RepID=UPI00235460B9|nr:hypothetical protein [Roseateles chitosanitabidus]
MHRSSYCPLCKEAHGVGLLRVWNSGVRFPATCKRCRGGFYPDRLPSAIVAELVFFPIGLAATYMGWSWTAAGLYVLGFVVATAAVRATCPLVGMDGPKSP